MRETFQVRASDSLQDAIDAAPPGAVISPDAGRHRLRTTLRVAKDLDIVGDGRAILDGNGLHRIVELFGVGRRYTFRGVAFEDGFADAGGAVHGMNENRVEFDGCRFVRNHARSRGAAVSLFQATGRFRRCVFARNVCLGATGGGAVAARRQG